MDPAELRERLPHAALSFRGYNLTNLGRSRELLLHPQYGPTVESFLRRASRVCTEVIGRPTDLIARVRENRETSLDSYADAVALIAAMEMAQLQLLEEFFDIVYASAQVSLGYSLGEIVAAVAGQVVTLEDALVVPLRLAADCVALAQDVSLAVLFSRGERLSSHDVQRLCLEINCEARGVIGISAYLAPNSLLLMGQGDTLDRFRQRMKAAFPEQVYLRKNQGDWPPLHTPIVWQRNIPNRVALIMQTMPGGLTAPTPPILSLVTGKVSYDDLNARELLHRWVDHPQRLWDAVYEALAMGIETLVHVGPEPNIIPATFKRLQDNVEAQTRGSIGMRALSVAVRRTWLKSLLPQRTALLRATLVKQLILEDWLLEQRPG